MENDHPILLYSSPIGVLQIKSAGEIVTEIDFLEDDSISCPYPENKFLIRCYHELEEYFSGKRQVFTIPFDQPGTLFQQEVWKAVSTIPFGTTVSYLDLAKKTGNPKNIRAVGAANGKNKIAILVPCHRVIGNNDALVGYAWGLWRKQWLLEHEGKTVNGIQLLFD